MTDDSKEASRRKTPHALIVESANVPEELRHLLPSKWEMLGKVLLMKLPNALRPHEGEVARAYAEILGAEAVLEDRGISGTLRKPDTRLILGNQKDCETVHKENCVRYALNPAKVMFSSGNIDERVRMATISNPEEIVVDMFAGIGYFTIPIAVHSKPEKLYACEMNPEAFGYLEKNIALNKVEGRVIPLLGDNRMTAPRGIADRVLMGYLPTTHLFLDTALSVLGETGGMIHYHETCPVELLPERPQIRIADAARAAGRRFEILLQREIKSYAPGVDHVVLDVRIS